MNRLLLLCGALLATPVLADEPNPFANDTSYPRPLDAAFGAAHLYRLTRPRVELAATRSTRAETTTSKTAATRVADATSRYDVHTATPLPFGLAAALGYEQWKEAGDARYEVDLTEPITYRFGRFVRGPAASLAARVGPVVVGARHVRYTVEDRLDTTELGDVLGSDDATRVRFPLTEPSAVFIAEKYEVGVTGSPRLDVRDGVASVRSPAQATLLYQRLLHDGAGTLVAALGHRWWSALDPERRNAWTLTFGEKQRVDAVELGAFLRYQARSWRDDEAASPSTIAKYGADLLARYDAGNGNELGVTASYLTGRGEGADAGDGKPAHSSLEYSGQLWLARKY